MSYEFELDHKKTTILVGVFFALLILVFAAGWLSGALFGIPQGQTEKAAVMIPRLPPRESPPAAPVKIVLPPAAPEPRFAVQVGAFQTAGQALRQARVLREKGFSPYVLKGQNSKGVTWFTVRISDHADHEKALAAAEAFELAEGTAPVVTYLDTLAVVRSADGSPPSGSVLVKGERLDLDTLADESGKAEAQEPNPAPEADGDADAGSDDSPAGTDAAGDLQESDPDTEPDEGGDVEMSLESDDDAIDSVVDTDDGQDEPDPTLEMAQETEPATEDGDAGTDTAAGIEGAGQDPTPETAGDMQRAVEDSDVQAADMADAAAKSPDVDDFSAESEARDDGGDPEEEATEGAESRFSVQVGAFLKDHNAYGLAEKLRTGGHGAYVFDVEDAAGKTWYAVRIDDYRDKQEALAAAQKAREEEGLPALVTRIDSLDVVAVPGGGAGLVDAGEKSLIDKPLYTETADSSGRHPYSLRLASYRTRAAADHAVAVYRQKGLAAFLFPAVGSSGETFHLVHMGLYDSFAAAQAAKAELNLTGAMIKKTPWGNLVGVYGQMAEAQAQAARLAEAGFSSYLALEQDSAVRVLTGAFSTREQAEAYGEILAEADFHSAVVER